MIAIIRHARGTVWTDDEIISAARRNLGSIQHDGQQPTIYSVQHYGYRIACDYKRFKRLVLADPWLRSRIQQGRAYGKSAVTTKVTDSDIEAGKLRERQARLDSIRDTPLIEPRPYDPDGPCGWQRREYWRAWKRIKGGKGDGG